jgi:outer membrane biosynthesis protein TonB
MKWLIAFLLTFTITQAEEITTGNLLPNGTGSASNLQSVDTNIPNVQSSCSSFTSVNTTCTNSNWNYQEVEVGSTSSGTGTLNYQGSLVDVATGDETSTQAMLDNGVTLDSTTVVQNCEWSGSSHQCGQAQSGRDTFKTTVKILDSDGNVLSQVDQIRNTDSGYYANANKYTDQVIYNGTGSNKFDWTWTGIDGDSTPVNLGGPNLLGAKLTMTYDNTVIANEIIEEIEDIFEELQEEIFEEFTFEYIEEMFEEFTLIAPPMEEVIEEEFEEMTFEPMLIVMEEMPMEEIMEEEMIIEEMPMEEEISTSFFSMMLPQEEEIYEETEEIIASFLPMVSQEEETFTEEKIIEEEEIMEEEPKTMAHGFPQEEKVMEEEMIEEEPEEMVEEEVMEEETTEMAEEEAVEEEPTKMVEANNEEEKEEIKEEKSNSETPKKSTVQTKKLAKQKKIQQKKAIVKNLDRIMDKVDKDIKDISKNLAVKNIIKMEAMTSEQASLNAYANTAFYKPKDIYLDQLNIFDNRQIYPNTNLASYTQNDKIEIKAKKLQEINSRKQQLLMELEILKNG